MLLGSTWPGDSFRAAILETVLNVVEEEQLVDRARTIGKLVKR